MAAVSRLLQAVLSSWIRCSMSRRPVLASYVLRKPRVARQRVTDIE